MNDSFHHTMESLVVRHRRYSRLVVVGHVGATLWGLLQGKDLLHTSPNTAFDDYSRLKVREFCSDVLGGANYRLLYPSDFSVPLQHWGSLLGWSHPSPLGLGIHPKYGLWFAYRAAFLVDAPLPVTPTVMTSSPCETCTNKPCVAACPPQALTAASIPNVQACSAFRLEDSSPCASTCLARYACPVGRDYRYPRTQMKFHAQKSLEMLRRWYSEDSPKAGE